MNLETSWLWFERLDVKVEVASLLNSWKVTCIVLIYKYLYIYVGQAIVEVKFWYLSKLKDMVSCYWKAEVFLDPMFSYRTWGTLS